MSERQECEPSSGTARARFSAPTLELPLAEHDELARLAARAWDECYCEQLDADPVRQGWRAVAFALHSAVSTPLQLRLNSAEARLVLAMRILAQQASRAEAAERWVREQGPAVLSLLAGEPQHAEDAHALQSAVQELRAIVRRAGT